MKYRIYFDGEDIVNGIRDFDTVKELLDFIAEQWWDIFPDCAYRHHSKSKVYKNNLFRINYISEIEEKVISLEEPIRVAIEIGKKNAEAKYKKIEDACRKFSEVQERAKYEELKKKFEGS